MVLADALELDAGCTDEAILQHLRGRERCWNCFEMAGNRSGDECREQGCVDGWIPLSGPHVRGCFVIDLILGKE